MNEDYILKKPEWQEFETMKELETLYDPQEEIELQENVPVEMEEEKEELAASQEWMETQKLKELAQGHYRPVRANQVAPGKVRIGMPAGKSSIKTRRQARKELREQGIKRSDVSRTSLIMSSVLTQQVKCFEQTTKGHEAECAQAKVDGRILTSFCIPYRTAQNGRPLTPEDAQARSANEEFIHDYLSGDVKRRWRHLDRMVDELMDFKLHRHMLEDAYLERDVYEYHRFSVQLTYMDNVLNDEKNAPFFQHMEPERKRKLMRLMELKDWDNPFMNLTPTLCDLSLMKGLSFNNGQLSDDDIYEDSKDNELFQERIEEFHTMLDKALQGRDSLSPQDL